MSRIRAVFCVLMTAALLACTGIRAEASANTEAAAYVEVFGKQFDPDAELLDLSDIPLESTIQVEEILPMFPNLKQVDMCRCGIPDEEMAEFRRKYPDIQIVWEVTICTYFRIRTDITFFMPAKQGIGHGLYIDFTNLKYCSDMELIDLGHYYVEDTSFLNNMPNLKYLILCDGKTEDLSDIGNCTKLEFLELFLNPVTDFAPLTNLTNLADLNISYTPFYKKTGVGYVHTDDFGDVTPLYQMTWLDRLWMCNSRMEQAELDKLQAALPHTVFMFESYSSTDKGWRHSPHYFAGRDIVGGSYMVK